MGVEGIRYRGIMFRRYPEAMQWADRSYFTPGIADRQRGVRRLHEELYREHHGEPPPGWHVHHKDHNPLNNDPTNLVALPPAEHQATHAESRRGQGITPEHLAQMQAGAAAWHRSPKGRAWHAEHGARVWAKRTATERVCDHCGSRYATKARHGAERFCSNACKSAARRASGVDRVDRTCAVCSTAFSVDRYSKARTCSKPCARRLPKR